MLAMHKKEYQGSQAEEGGIIAGKPLTRIKPMSLVARKKGQFVHVGLVLGLYEMLRAAGITLPQEYLQERFKEDPGHIMVIEKISDLKTIRICTLKTFKGSHTDIFVSDDGLEETAGLEMVRKVLEEIPNNLGFDIKEKTSKRYARKMREMANIPPNADDTLSNHQRRDTDLVTAALFDAKQYNIVLRVLKV